MRRGSYFLFAGLAITSFALVSFDEPWAPGRASGPSVDTLYQELTEEQKRSPRYALAGIDVYDNLNAQLFASEPMIANPTNLTIDDRGRAWICEAYNYRPQITGKPIKNEGDRIVILEDTDGDGVADKSKVFYQGPELNSPLGIWVMGNQAIVSQSPYVWLFTDDDGDDKADRKEIIFQGIKGEQHDHGVHSFVFGPDGNFYFNFGNEGVQLLDGHGKPVTGKDGKPIDFTKLKQGMLFRCDRNFKNLEVLGDNFRNNYEAAIDSYGTIWQSDNDDDGNKGVRINYVMEKGNYGYTDELTGAGWRAYRTNWEDSIPQRHWHLNDPGVVPNLLQTGAGSPTGLIVYEGKLLPLPFQNQMIHCDAGPNVVRAYPVRNSGAGYSASLVNMMEGKRDRWFRPSDICVAPDGSLLVSDWYDPGVGGHQVGDLNRGRVFRIAPNNSPYKIPAYDYSRPEGALKALENPNLSVRYRAFMSLSKSGENAVPVLQKAFDQTSNDSRLRARALWILAKLRPSDSRLITRATTDTDRDIRITAIRILRQSNLPQLQWLAQLATDADVQVRRECALSLAGLRSPGSAAVWTKLANGYDGADRWYLEALGIGATGQWDSFFAAWLQSQNQIKTPDRPQSDIIWRSRTRLAIPLLARLAGDEGVALKDRLRYFRAFDFNPGTTDKSQALLKLFKNGGAEVAEYNKLVLRHMDGTFVKTNPKAKAFLTQLINSSYPGSEYFDLVERFGITTENHRLLSIATDKANNSNRRAGQILFKQGGKALLSSAINGKDRAKALAAIASIRSIGSTESLEMLSNLALNPKLSDELRREAILAMGGSQDGEDLILKYLKEGKIKGAHTETAVRAVQYSWRRGIRNEIQSYLGSSAGLKQQHPAISELIQRKGDIPKGKIVFQNFCSACHQVDNEGLDFGPKLSEIGSKLPKEGQYQALFFPSAGISFGYEGYEVRFKDGSTVTGIISSKTETDLMMKFPGGTAQEYKMAQVSSIKQLNESLMTAGLQDGMSTTELVDLTEYLSSLTKK